MKKKTNPYLIWGLFTLAVVALLFGLAKLGSNSPGGNVDADGRPVSTGALLKPDVAEGEHAKGPKNAKVTLVEFSDFQCGFCKQSYPTVNRLLNDFPNDLRVVYRHFPLEQIHDHAKLSAQATEAAALQGKFWDLHDAIFNTQNEWKNLENAEEFFIKLAVSVGVEDEEKFKADLHSEAVIQAVDDDLTSGIASSVHATPTFYVNGVHLANPQDYDMFKQVIQDELDKVNNA